METRPCAHRYRRQPGVDYRGHEVCPRGEVRARPCNPRQPSQLCFGLPPECLLCAPRGPARAAIASRIAFAPSRAMNTTTANCLIRAGRQLEASEQGRGRGSRSCFGTCCRARRRGLRRPIGRDGRHKRHDEANPASALAVAQGNADCKGRLEETVGTSDTTMAHTFACAC
eukprot:15479244-Alexandrium_andersonii.AAC.2